MWRPKPERNPFRKRTIKTVITIITVLILITLATLYYFSQKEEPLLVTYPVCDLSQEEIAESFNNYHFDEKVIIEDYFFFGETLSMFEDTYNIKKRDSLIGKTIILENICNNEEYFYLIDDDVDGQILLNQLPEGLYEVFINIDLIKKRVVTTEKLTDKINLVRRNNKTKNIKLISDKNMFDDKDNKNLLVDNYLFIDINDNGKSNNDYDIVLDPAFGTNPSGWHDDFGPKIEGMTAADELYRMAEIIKNKLEDEGFKVLILRNDEKEIVNVYGNEGRLNRAYDSKAKYYVELGWGSSENGGFRIYNSAFSSIQFAGSIANHLMNETNIDSQSSSGIYIPTLYNGLDGIMSIREVGGKALQAATVSDLAIEANSDFALDNRHGLEGISIEFISSNNSKQVKDWKENKEFYAQETAQAIINFLDTGDEDDLSD